jgi:hypothetical protein
MRTDCLLKVRWQQRMLRPDVKENMSPQEQQVGGPRGLLACLMRKAGQSSPVQWLRWTPSTVLHVAVLVVNTFLSG